MQRALVRHQSGHACVIPVIIRSVDWSGALFAELQALPKDAKAVASWKDTGEAWTDVARGNPARRRRAQETPATILNTKSNHTTFVLVCTIVGKIPPAPFVKGGAQRTGDLSPQIMGTNLVRSDLEATESLPGEMLVAIKTEGTHLCRRSFWPDPSIDGVPSSRLAVRWS